MGFTATATTVGLCLFCLSPWLNGECSGKTFRLATTGDGATGSILCAVSEASQTTSTNDLPSPVHGLPPEVRCAQRCTSQALCHSFNFRSDDNSCQFYDYEPTVCQPIPNCVYYQVKKFIISIIISPCILFYYAHVILLRLGVKSPHGFE